MKYDGLLFDFDGVIADTEPLHWNSWRFALAPYGLDLSWDDYCRVCRGLAPSAMRPALRTVVPGVDRVPDLEDRYHQAKDEAFAHLADNPPITPETIEMLHGLKSVIRAGLVTSAMRITVEPVLHKTGLHSVFDAFVYREDVTHPKPAPDAYRIGAERLGGQRILVFEDTPAGLESARAAGLDVVFVDDCARLPELVRQTVYSDSRKISST